MPMDFSTYLTQINDALIAENGPNLAYLLRPSSPHGKELVKAFRNQATKATLAPYTGSLQSPWDEICIEYVLVCTCSAKRQDIDAYKAQSQLVNLFFRFFGENKGWTLQALFSILRDLRVLAHNADLFARYHNIQNESIEDSARIISKAFSLCVGDRISPPDQSRKWGVYYVVGLIMKSYFRIKKISLSKNILRGLNAADIPPLSMYPRSHQVTYQYYIGMISFLNEEYAKSEQELTLAFYNCNVDARDNQERILTYLLPLRILKGHLPSEELLARFPALRDLFRPFISAILSGDPTAFDKALDEGELRLTGLNLWFTLEKARELCIRGVFRRVWLVAEKVSRMPVSMFHAGLRAVNQDVTQEETECLLANMIYKGYMRGYISHEKQTVVLANTNAFPRVADRPSPYSFV